MHKKFDSQTIEKKWQAKWEESGIYNVGDRDDSKEKEYVLVELPYPSGNLHIGHWHAFAVPDIYVRYRKMTGKQVVYPMGFDAFGLPAENAAIKRNINPREWTQSNIEYMKSQLASMGASFSWDKTASTIDPDYYKWTQWMFTQFFENDIAYRGKGTVNWCPGCNTVIANEQVLADGTCERSGDSIEKKTMPQWMLRITNYADRLVDDLEDLNWPEHIKEAQRRWIGRSEGAEINFKLSTGDEVTVFTTRPDTLFGATYMVLAPEHELVQKNADQITNWNEVSAYIETTRKKAEQDRLDDTKEKTGIKLEGITAINPANNEEIPVYIADYVLASYGTGAIMAVPAHDERDYAFANKYSIPIKTVVAELTAPHSGALLEVKDKPGTFLFQQRDSAAPILANKIGFFGGGKESFDTDNYDTAIRELDEELELKVSRNDFVNTFVVRSEVPDKCLWVGHIKNVDPSTLVLHEGEAIIELTLEEAVSHPDTSQAVKEVLSKFFGPKPEPFVAAGLLIDSGKFDEMSSEEAKVKITEKVGGEMTNTYRLRDWSVGRQRYWGVPIPIVYDPEGKAHVVPEEHLPWTLPEDVDFRPTGEPPLAKSDELKRRTEEIFGKGWTPEVETMDTFVDSSWYFLRYIDNKNESEFASLDEQTNWMPIDLYFGGAEHTTMHLLYSRFWQKALYDLKLVTEAEPYKRRINRGLILGPDGNKMSKSKGNVIDPDEQVALVGADTVKMYLAFMGPYGETANYPWDMGGIAGIRRFLERVYGLSEHIIENEDGESERQLHKTVKKVGVDITLFKFNTAISSLMTYVNQVEKTGLTKSNYEILLQLLAPFAPHLAEELWEEAGHTESIHLQAWPTYDESLTVDNEITIGVQVNGKMRGQITVNVNTTEAEAVKLAESVAEIKTRIESGVKKIIYVPGRILNLITGD